MMGIIGGALGGIVGGFLDGDGGVGAANGYNAGLNSMINSILRGQQVQNRLGFIQAEKRYKEAITNAEGRLDRSEADVRGITRGSKQAVYDNAQQQSSGAAQSLLNRGLLNSSVGATMQRGINADTQRSLGNIDAQQSGILSQLGQQRAGLMAGLETGYAGLPIQEGQLGTNLAGVFTGALGQQGHVAQGSNNMFGQLGGALGSFLPF